MKKSQKRRVNVNNRNLFAYALTNFYYELSINIVNYKESFRLTLSNIQIQTIEKYTQIDIYIYIVFQR